MSFCTIFDSYYLDKRSVIYRFLVKVAENMYSDLG